MTWNLLRFGWLLKVLSSVLTGIKKSLEKRARVLTTPLRNIVKVMSLAITFNSNDV